MTQQLSSTILPHGRDRFQRERAWERRSQSYFDWERHLNQLQVNCTKSTQLAPKFAYLRSKIENLRSKIENFFSGEGHSPSQTPPPVVKGTSTPPRRLDLAYSASPPFANPGAPLFGSHTSFLGSDACHTTNILNNSQLYNTVLTTQ